MSVCSNKTACPPQDTASDEADAAPSCPGCLGLRYDRFQVPTKEPLLHQGQRLRYHVSSFWELEEAAKRGCQFCSIIARGIHYFWDINSSSLAQKALWEQERYYRGTTSEASPFGANDEDFKFYRPCIELRPNLSLLVSRVLSKRVKFVGHCFKLVPGEPEFEHFLKRAPLEFYSNGGKTVSQAFGQAQPVPLTVDMAYCERLLSRWLSNCMENHPECRKDVDNNAPPKRLLDVSNQGLRLVETTANFKEKYTTLSHCWGGELESQWIPKTLKSNVHQRLRYVDPGELPHSFHDAILVTRIVACHYLWIDSLCIVQDDDEDWKEQSYQMARIYSQSLLNIAATASPNSLKGLFFERFHPCEPDVQHPNQTRLMQPFDLSHEIFVRPFPQVTHGNFLRRRPEDKHSPLLERGWVYQERLLSRRTIHFTASEVVWECRTHTDCECGEFKNLDANCQLSTAKSQFQMCFQADMPEKSVLDLWLSIVTRYSKLRLTNLKDRPFAFAGIAQRICAHINSGYLAGIWVADLPRALLWIGIKSSVSHQKPNHMQEGASDPASPGPPSWSWLAYCSWDGSTGVLYQHYLENFLPDSRLVLDFENTYCETENSNIFGPVLRGSLTLRGVLAKGMMLTGGHYRVPLGFSRSRIPEDAYILFDESADPIGYPLHTDYYLSVKGQGNESKQEVFCLLVGQESRPAIFKKGCRYFVIVLKRINELKCCYRRIGIAKWPMSSRVFEGCVDQTLEIV